MWKGLPRQRVWGAVSRALKTPSLEDRGIHVDLAPRAGPSGLPVFVTVLGNPLAETEELINAEGGYRAEIGTRGSIDVTVFAGRYEHLKTQEQGAPAFSPIPSPRVLVTTVVGSGLAATTRGLEVAANWEAASFWRLDGNYSAFAITPKPAAGSLDAAAATFDAGAPRHKWHIRSTFSMLRRATLNASVYHAGPLVALRIPAWTRADLNAEWRFTPQVSVMVIGQNLLDDAHVEFSGASTLLVGTQVRRSAAVRLRWTFQ